MRLTRPDSPRLHRRLLAIVVTALLSSLVTIAPTPTATADTLIVRDKDSAAPEIDIVRARFTAARRLVMVIHYKTAMTKDAIDKIDGTLGIYRRRRGYDGPHVTLLIAYYRDAGDGDPHWYLTDAEAATTPDCKWRHKIDEEHHLVRIAVPEECANVAWHYKRASLFYYGGDGGERGDDVGPRKVLRG